MLLCCCLVLNQLLDKLRPKVTTDQVTTAMLKENASKNRSTQILPGL